MESINYYHILLQEGKSKEEALEILGQRSRDNSRSPMQWNDGTYSGFSEKEPWIGIPGNYKYINVAAEEQDSDSVLNYYRELIRLRKKYPIIQEGSIEFLHGIRTEIFAYKRILGEQELFVFNNMTDENMDMGEAVSCEGLRRLIGNYPWERQLDKLGELRPYESVVLMKG